MISDQKNNDLKLNLKNFRYFLGKGYSLRELFFRGLRLKIWSKLNSIFKYKFYSIGNGVDIDHRSTIDGSRYISIGNHVWIQRGVWLTVPLIDILSIKKRPYLIVEDKVRIGPNCTIAAANKITIGEGVLFGPNVSVFDHCHRYSKIDRPISVQGIQDEGEIIFEPNSWVGINSVIYSASKKITIGRNSVIAANSVVRDNVEPFTVVSGNPAKIIKRFNSQSQLWENIKKINK